MLYMAKNLTKHVYLKGFSLNLHIYIRSKYLNEFLINIWKELKIFTFCNQFFSTNDFDSSGGKVMKFPASGHRSFWI